MINKDCFAYISDTRCRALTHMKCDTCTFYKLKEELNLEQLERDIRYYNSQHSLKGDYSYEEVDKQSTAIP